MKYLALMVATLLTSCTLSFQNIDTHGTATDLVDDTQTPTVSTTATVPISAVPNVPKLPGISK